MAVRDSFVAVNDGDQLNDGYFNGMRTTLIDTSSGHDHDGTDSKRIGVGWVWVATADRTSSNLDSTGFTWSSLAGKRLWRITYWANPVFTSASSSEELIGMRINGDSGAQRYITFHDGGSTLTTYFILGGLRVVDDQNIRTGACASWIIGNQQLDNMDASDDFATPIAGTTGGHGGVSGANRIWTGGYYYKGADVDSITIFSVNNKAVSGVWVLEYLSDGDE